MQSSSIELAGIPARLPNRGERIVLVVGTMLALGISGYVAGDRLTWLLVLHALVLIHGGTYTYALTPGGFWLQDLLGTTRNPWDRLGHLMQGFVPAVLARELFLRLTPLRRGGWLFYLVLAACLSFSAFFEFIEWWAALIYGADADAFLATQGDPWDTQWDMFLCLCGAIASLALLPRWHDRQLGPALLVDK